jgi:catechol 2,3-dioxygenase-like lactoylglutathione lyase family enzyme
MRRTHSAIPMAKMIAVQKTEVLHEALEDETPLSCYSLSVFTLRWRESRDFYVDVLGAKVLSERAERYCEMVVGGLPLCLRKAECGEMMSYLHLYLSMKNRKPVLKELRKRGIIITTVGPYTNFRDPEGRVIKLSEASTLIS